MRCSCRECGEYMVHEEKGLGRCVCPVCGNICTDCLGTDTVMSRDYFDRIRNDPAFEAEMIRRMEETEERENQ